MQSAVINGISSPHTNEALKTLDAKILGLGKAVGAGLRFRPTAGHDLHTAFPAPGPYPLQCTDHASAGMHGTSVVTN
jgi:plastocyanin